MTLADELQQSLTLDADPDLPAIRARVDRRRRRLHLAQGGAVGALLVAAVAVLALRPVTSLSVLAEPPPPARPTALLPAARTADFGIEEVILQQLEIGGAVEVEVWVANHGASALTVNGVGLRRWQDDGWQALPALPPSDPTLVPPVTRGIVHGTFPYSGRLPADWYAVEVAFDGGTPTTLGLALQLDDRLAVTDALLPDVAAPANAVRLQPMTDGFDVTNGNTQAVSIAAPSVARWDGAGWRDIPRIDPAVPARTLTSGESHHVPLDTTQWALWRGDPWMSAEGFPPGWYRLTVQVVTPTPATLQSVVHAAAGPTCQVVLLGELTTTVVAPGETLESIAARVYGNPERSGFLAEANCLDPDAPLQEGRELLVPPP